MRFDWDFPGDVEKVAGEEMHRPIPTHKEMWSSIWAAARRLNAHAKERTEALRALGDEGSDLTEACRRAAEKLAKASARISEPVPLILICPGPSLTTRGAVCGARHIDRGIFATTPHHTHACQECGHVWRPSDVNTVGVESIPGYVSEARRAADVAMNELSSRAVDEALRALERGREIDAVDRLVNHFDELSSCAIDQALRAIERGREIDAVDLLVDHFDVLLLAGEFGAARRALTRLDPRRLPPKVLSGVLMVSAHARKELGDTRTEFLVGVRSALAETWRLDTEAIEGIVRRYG